MTSPPSEAPRGHDFRCRCEECIAKMFANGRRNGEERQRLAIGFPCVVMMRQCDALAKATDPGVIAYYRGWIEGYQA